MKRTPTSIRIAGVAVAGALALSMAACSNSGDSPESGGKESVTIGYSTFNLTNPYFAGILAGLEKQTDEFGWELVVTNSNTSVEGQVSDIENLITQGVDILMLTPADAEAVTPAIKAADQAGIPVFALGDTVTAEIAQQVLPDSVAAAESAADEIAAFLTEKYGEPKGLVANVRGLAGLVVEAQRQEGFERGLAKYPDIEVVAEGDGGFDTAAANALMTDMLQANKKIDAVWAANDAMSVGVSAAIKSAGRFKPVGDPDHIYVIGMDGAKPAIEDIRAGVQDATVSQNPIEMSALAVRNVKELMADKELENLVYFPTLLITTENIESPEVEKYGIWADLVK